MPTLSVSLTGSTADTLGPHKGQLPVREISSHASSAGALMNRLALSVMPPPVGGRSQPLPVEGCSRPRSRRTLAGGSDGAHVDALCHGLAPWAWCRAYARPACPARSSPEPPVT